MFQIGHIISASHLVRKFQRVSNYLKDTREPILVSQRNGPFLVVMNAYEFERLIFENMKVKGLQPPQATLRDQLDAC